MCLLIRVKVNVVEALYCNTSMKQCVSQFMCLTHTHTESLSSFYSTLMGTLMAKDLLKLKPPQLTVLPIEQSFMWLRAFVLMQGNEHVVAAKPNDGGR